MPDFVQVEPDDPRAVEALGRYFSELNRRFESGFDPGSGSSGAEGVFLVLVEDEGVVGCGAIHLLDAGTAEIKRMWVDPDWRGRGLGKRLLTALESEARNLGRSRVVLDTNDTLEEAIAMYEHAGYLRIDRYNDNPYAQQFFEKDI